MDTAIKMLRDIIGKLTSDIIALLRLGIEGKLILGALQERENEPKRLVPECFII